MPTTTRNRAAKLQVSTAPAPAPAPAPATRTTRTNARAASVQPAATEPPSTRRSTRTKPSIEDGEEAAGLPNSRGRARARGRAKETASPVASSTLEGKQADDIDALLAQPDSEDNEETQGTIALASRHLSPPNEESIDVFEDAPEEHEYEADVEGQKAEVQRLAELSGTTFNEVARPSGASTELNGTVARNGHEERTMSQEEAREIARKLIDAVYGLEWSASRIIKNRTPADVYDAETYDESEVDEFYARFYDRQNGIAKKTRPAAMRFRDAYTTLRDLPGSSGGLYIDVRHSMAVLANSFEILLGHTPDCGLGRAQLILYMANLALLLDDVDAIRSPGKQYFILNGMIVPDKFTTLDGIQEDFMEPFASGLGDQEGESQIANTINVATAIRVQYFIQSIASLKKGEQEFMPGKVLDQIFFDEQAVLRGWKSSGMQTDQLSSADQEQIMQQVRKLRQISSDFGADSTEALQHDLETSFAEQEELLWPLAQWAKRRQREIRGFIARDYPGKLQDYTDSLRRELASAAGSGSQPAAEEVHPADDGYIQGEYDHDQPSPQGDGEGGEEQNGEDEDFGAGPAPPFPPSQHKVRIADVGTVPLARLGPSRFTDAQSEARSIALIDTQPSGTQTGVSHQVDGDDGVSDTDAPGLQKDNRDVGDRVQELREKTRLDQEARNASRKRPREHDEESYRQESPAKRQRQDEIGHNRNDEDADEESSVEVQHWGASRSKTSDSRTKTSTSTSAQSGSRRDVKNFWTAEEDEFLLAGIERYRDEHGKMNKILDKKGYNRREILNMNVRRNQDLTNRARILKIQALNGLGPDHMDEMPPGLNSIALKRHEEDKLRARGFDIPEKEEKKRRLQNGDQ